MNQQPEILEILGKNENNNTLRMRKDIKFDLTPSGDFLKFMRMNSIFLDKSLLIKDILENKVGNEVYTNL